MATVWVQQQTVRRLSDDFRRDAHAARSAEIVTQNEHPTLILKSVAASDAAAGAKQITYLAEANRVTRRETDGETIVRQEVYRLPDSRIVFEAKKSANSGGVVSVGQSLQLICRRPNSALITRQTSQPRRDDAVLAVIGRDHRFEKAGKPAAE